MLLGLKRRNSDDDARSALLARSSRERRNDGGLLMRTCFAGEELGTLRGNLLHLNRLLCSPSKRPKRFFSAGDEGRHFPFSDLIPPPLVGPQSSHTREAAGAC